MRIISLDEIKPLLKKAEVIKAVREGFIEYAKGEVSCPAPMQILFHDKSGELSADCHVKSALGEKQKYFVIKIASGFYENAKKGLDVNSGMSLVMSASTGEPLAMLDDKGDLTSQRTAAAGANEVPNNRTY